MCRTRGLLAIAIALFFVIGTDGSTRASDLKDDRIELPSTSRVFRSPNGKFVLVLHSEDAWKSKYATAVLARVGKAPEIWQKTLPQELGPRYLVLDNHGGVLLVEEWIHVRSQHAIVVLDPAGLEVAHYSFDDVQRALAVLTEQIVK